MSISSPAVVTPLDPLTFPLHGARLIEASAGTGKTFTIAALYLRLLLGHGNADTRHPTPLTVDQILVVTFTEAATAELRDRIRQRIHQARIAFLRGASDDPVIQGLLADYADRPGVAKVLLQAERQMDEAAVYTIHGFCQRMLTQNAFESGSRFSNEFVTDESQLKAQVVADYWRRQFYPLPLNLVAEVRRLWPSPQALLDKIGGYLTGAPLTLSVEAMKGDLTALYHDGLSRIADLKQQWLASCRDLPSSIQDSDLHAATKKALLTRLELLNVWANQPHHQFDLPSELSDFAQSALEAKAKKGNPPNMLCLRLLSSFYKRRSV